MGAAIRRVGEEHVLVGVTIVCEHPSFPAVQKLHCRELNVIVVEFAALLDPMQAAIGRVKNPIVLFVVIALLAGAHSPSVLEVGKIDSVQPVIAKSEQTRRMLILGLPRRASVRCAQNDLPPKAHPKRTPSHDPPVRLVGEEHIMKKVVRVDV